MLNLVIALTVGVAVGFFMPSGFMSKPKSLIFYTALLGLLFFMGVNLGRDPELLSKLAHFGIISLVMSFTVVVFSVISVVVLVKLFSGQKQ
ncbi:hypothetical protein Dacet_2152 [Denitrovibrio acetiphilus DSM 12809]|uniref:DUF340 domain-containing protein n=1 Tax=Denitrovibrio acetiphilus (strain DSM 12809 / NBRC 114555 / N2460) TaxID=522772 RepID=D4H2C3_DENA2|nr:LysO family transporter [Denitrovibrio acetiphilus]ADD68914.1 hypothetical protein Dacet_2152 [Denitrovibrio acetiphilus DSM 12809]